MSCGSRRRPRRLRADPGRAGILAGREGATLATGGGHPGDLERGWYIEPTVFGNVDNQSVIAQQEIFGPVLSVIPAADEDDAVRIDFGEGQPEGYEDTVV